MNFQDLIITSRVYLSSFDSDHYPENFRRFEEAAGPLFDALDGKDPALEAKQLIDELEKNRGTIPAGLRKHSVWTSPAQIKNLAVISFPNLQVFRKEMTVVKRTDHSHFC